MGARISLNKGPKKMKELIELLLFKLHLKDRAHTKRMDYYRI